MAITQKDFSVKGNKLIFKSGVEKVFDADISKTLVLGDVLVILLDYMRVPNENVYGVDKDGNLLWRIQQEKFPYKENPYANIYELNGRLGLSNYSGFQIEADPLTGKILKKEFTK